MCAGNADGAGVGVCHIAQQHAALYRGDAQTLRLFHLGVALQNGGRIHHQLRAVHIFSPVAVIHRDAHGLFPFHNVAFAHVRARYLIPHRVQNLHQRKHAAAANAYKVELCFSVQQIAVETVHAVPPRFFIQNII